MFDTAFAAPRFITPRMMRGAFFLLLVVVVLLTSACAPSPGNGNALRKAIVGKWVNQQNFTIDFYEDGTGFVPGTDGEVPVPATDFTYVVTDDSHIRLTMGDLNGAIIEIKIEGDQMTWTGKDTGLSFVYTRSK